MGFRRFRVLVLNMGDIPGEETDSNVDLDDEHEFKPTREHLRNPNFEGPAITLFHRATFENHFSQMLKQMTQEVRDA